MRMSSCCEFLKTSCNREGREGKRSIAFRKKLECLLLNKSQLSQGSGIYKDKELKNLCPFAFQHTEKGLRLLSSRRFEPEWALY